MNRFLANRVCLIMLPRAGMMKNCLIKALLMEASISYLKTILCDTLFLRLQVLSSSTATNCYYNYKLPAVILEDINNYQSVSESFFLFCIRFKSETEHGKGVIIRDLGTSLHTKKKRVLGTGSMLQEMDGLCFLTRGQDHLCIKKR